MKDFIKIYIIKIIDFLLKTLNIIFIILIISLIIISIFKPDWIELFLTWIWKKVILLWNWNYLIAFISSCIESFPVFWVFFPGQQIMLTVWWFFWKNNLIFMIIVSIIWAIIWNYIWYLLWKMFWEKFFINYWEWFWLWDTELKILKKQIEKNWAFFIILWKFHNFTRSFVPFIAWSMWMKEKKFWVYNILWSILWAICIIILWVLFVEYYKLIFDNFWYILLWIILIVWLYIYIFKKNEFINYIKEKNLEIDKKVNSK